MKKTMSKNRFNFPKIARSLTIEETQLVQGQGQEDLPPPSPTTDVRAHIITGG